MVRMAFAKIYSKGELSFVITTTRSFEGVMIGMVFLLVIILGGGIDSAS